MIPQRKRREESGPRRRPQGKGAGKRSFTPGKRKDGGGKSSAAPGKRRYAAPSGNRSFAAGSPGAAEKKSFSGRGQRDDARGQRENARGPHDKDQPRDAASGRRPAAAGGRSSASSERRRPGAGGRSFAPPERRRSAPSAERQGPDGSPKGRRPAAPFGKRPAPERAPRSSPQSAASRPAKSQRTAAAPPSARASAPFAGGADAPTGAMRLNRYLAAAGLGSRRACEEIISAGRVTINGHTCDVLATTVSPGDAVKVDGRPVQTQRLVYILLNKPAGYLSTRTDPDQRDTVFDLLPQELPRLFHVGRLDQDSEGLLILTNDGDLALRLTHPRYKVDKEYEVALDRTFDMTLSERMVEGVFIPVEGEGIPLGQRIRARAVAVHRLNPQKLKVILRQGLKRQVRLMFAELGYEVKRLQRTRLGALSLGRVRLGEWRHLNAQEVALLKKGEPAKS